MGSYQCPGDGCGNEVSRQPVRDDAGRRWVGTTCRDCEQRALDGLSERDLARLTLDPYLRPAVVRTLFERQSEPINAALAQRGRRYLQPSVADALGVVDDDPAAPLVPFWPRYRSFEGDRDGATLAAGPAAWTGLVTDEHDDDDELVVVAEDAARLDGPEAAVSTAAVTAVVPAVESDDREETSAETEPVAATEVMPVTDEAAPIDDGAIPVDEEAGAAPPAPRRRRTLWALAAVVLLAGVGLVWALTQGGGDDTDERSGSTVTGPDAGADTTSPSAESTTATTTVRTTVAARPATTARATTTADTSDETTPSSDSSSPSSTASGATSTSTTESSAAPTSTVPAASAADAARWVDVVDGSLALRGTVPDDATADAISAVLGEVAGDNEVVLEVENARSSPAAAALPLVVRNADLFEAGSTTPNESVGDLIDLGVALLDADPGVTIEIGGHTDDVGEEASNLELSEARAQAIADALIEAGADEARLSVQAYGETEPVGDNGTESGRAENRRIELAVSGLFD